MLSLDLQTLNHTDTYLIVRETATLSLAANCMAGTVQNDLYALLSTFYQGGNSMYTVDLSL